MNLLTKQKDSQIQKTNSWLPKGKGQGEDAKKKLIIIMFFKEYQFIAQ